MSCGSDSDKWPRPSNMNFAADQRGGKKCQPRSLHLYKASGRYVKIQHPHEREQSTSALFMTVLKRVKEQPCVFLFSPFLGLGSFSSSQPSAATTKVDLSLR